MYYATVTCRGPPKLWTKNRSLCTIYTINLHYHCTTALSPPDYFFSPSPSSLLINISLLAVLLLFLSSLNSSVSVLSPSPLPALPPLRSPSCLHHASEPPSSSKTPPFLIPLSGDSLLILTYGTGLHVDKYALSALSSALLPQPRWTPCRSQSRPRKVTF